MVIYDEDNSWVINNEDGTCTKIVDLPKCYSRLSNEAKCLEILNGFIAPKLISYDDDKHVLSMEYIEGLTLTKYIDKFGEIPKFYFAQLTTSLLQLLDHGIEYGADMKYDQHFIIDDKNNIRIIDFGISNILQGRDDIIEYWRENTVRNFAFVFKNSTEEDIVESWERMCKYLYRYGISDSVMDKYFSNYDKI